MGQTPNLGIPFPEQTDPPDGAGQMQALATRVDNVALAQLIADAKGDLIAGTGPDTMVRLPVGTDNQILTADSAAASGVSWKPGPAGTYIPVGLLDAKGDLIAASANDTPARVPLGPDGNVLTADASQPAGVRWQTPAAGGAGEIGYAQIASVVTLGTAATDVVSDVARTYDGSPAIVEFFAPAVQLGAVAGVQVQINLWDAGTDLGMIAQVLNPAAGGLIVPVLARRRLTPTAASHTYRIRALYFGAGGSATINGGAGGAGAISLPAYIRISRA